MKLFHRLLSLLSLFVPLLLFSLNPVNGQPPTPVNQAPDCIFFINSGTLSGGSAATINFPTGNGFDNRTLGCQTWTFSYQATATGGTMLTSLEFQAATGATLPIMFAAWAGTVETGINPNTDSSRGTSTFSTGCASGMACNVDDSWVRVQLARGTFTGVINGVLYGYRTGPSGGGGGSGGSGCPDPCPVIGVAADGVALSGAPVRVGMSDGTNARNMVSESSVGDANNGVNILAVAKSLFNGSTWSREANCPNEAAITLAAGTQVVVVAGVSSTNIRICHISFSWDATANVTIRQGTGTTCQTNTVSLTGAYQNLTGIALDWSANDGLHTTVAARDLCLLFSTSVTAGGTITYAQY